MLATKTISSTATNFFHRLYTIMVRIFGSKKEEAGEEPSYFDSEDLELKAMKELVDKQIEKYKNQTYMYLH